MIFRTVIFFFFGNGNFILQFYVSGGLYPFFLLRDPSYHRSVCMTEILLKISIDLSTVHKQVHTHIQPDHHHNDRSQAAIHVAETRKYFEIKGKSIREDRPCNGNDQCPRYLTFKCGRSVGKNLVQQQEHKEQHCKYQAGFWLRSPCQ